MNVLTDIALRSESVASHIIGLKNNKSERGMDGLLSSFKKSASRLTIFKPLVDMFMTSLDDGLVQLDLMAANITQTFKRGQRKIQQIIDQ